jgi:ferredoxin-NADP reductase
VNDRSFDTPLDFDDGVGLYSACETSVIPVERTIAWQRPSDPMPAFSVTPSAALRGGFNNALITKVTRETHECRSYEFNFPAITSNAFCTKPGQFVPVRVKISGETHQRYYAISSLVAQGEPLRMTIKRTPGGLVSNWCHDELRPGMTVSIGRPMGTFRLRRGSRPMLFMAAGIGIAPLFPMLKQAVLTSPQPIRIAIFDRDAQAAVFLGPLRNLAKHHPDRLQLAEIYTGSNAAHPRLLHQQFEALPEATAYACGPAGFLQCASTAAAAAGIAPERILINARDEIAARAVRSEKRCAATRPLQSAERARHAS